MQFIYINNYSRLGKIGISSKTIESIASKAVSEIPGAAVYYMVKKNDKSKKKNPLDFLLPDPVKVSLSPTTGKAPIKLDVAIKAGVNVGEICLALQKKIADASSLSCDTLPYEVKVRVAKILA